MDSVRARSAIKGLVNVVLSEDCDTYWIIEKAAAELSLREYRVIIEQISYTRDNEH